MIFDMREPRDTEIRAAQLTAYALGQLAPDEQREIEFELAVSESSSREVAETRLLAEVLGSVCSEPCQPSASIRDAIQQKLSSTEGNIMRHSTNQPTGRRARIRVIWTVAAMLLMTVSALAWTTFGDRGTSSPQVSAGRTERAPAPQSARQPSARRPVESAEESPAEESPAEVTGADPVKIHAPVAGIPAATVATPAAQPERRSEPQTEVPREAAVPSAAGSAPNRWSSSPTSVAPGNNVSGSTTGNRWSAGTTGPAGIGYPASSSPAGAATSGPAPSATAPPATAPSATARQTNAAPPTAQPYVSPRASAYASRSYGAAPGPRSGGAGYSTPQAPGYTAMPMSGGSPQYAPTASRNSSGYSPGYGASPVSSGSNPYGSPGTSPNSSAFLVAGNVPGIPSPYGMTSQFAHTGESYASVGENPFRSVADPKHARSTFSLDVDTASYANLRRMITGGSRPNPAAVRVEEMVNYFDYAYPPATKGKPFGMGVEVAECPWNRDHRLARIAVKARDIRPGKRPDCNFVFLIDVSGSMKNPDKLPLLKQSLRLLTAELTKDDRVTIVTYAGDAGVKLEATPGDQHDRIRSVIDSLVADGSTNGSAGIELAYQKAMESFIRGGSNRVLLASDGDVNAGITDNRALVKLVREQAQGGVFLTVLGVGTGDLQDDKMEAMADHGNGVYAYLDSLQEARRVLVDQLHRRLVTVAKDVKVQVEFNPMLVSSWRLIGYDNRVLSHRSFTDDTKDAGEIGAGDTVTVLYEIVPSAGSIASDPSLPKLKYQRPPTVPANQLTGAAKSGELMTIYLRYKEPAGEASQQMELAVKNSYRSFEEASGDFCFASSVAAFGMLLKRSPFVGQATADDVLSWAERGLGQDAQGDRTGFLDLVRRAQSWITPANPYTATNGWNSYAPAASTPR